MCYQKKRKYWVQSMLVFASWSERVMTAVGVEPYEDATAAVADGSSSQSHPAAAS